MAKNDPLKTLLVIMITLAALALAYLVLVKFRLLENL